MSDTGSTFDGSDDSYEVIDYSENPLYLILSALLQDDNGKTICDHLGRLANAMERNTAALERLAAARQK